MFGAVFVVYVPNLADAVTKAAPWATYGAVLLVCVYAMPQGVAGLVRALWNRCLARFASSRTDRSGISPAIRSASRPER